MSDEIDDFLESPLGLVTGDDGGDGNGRGQHGGDDAKICLPVADDV